MTAEELARKMADDVADHHRARFALLPYAALLLEMREALRMYVACQDRVMQPWENYEVASKVLARADEILVKEAERG